MRGRSVQWQRFQPSPFLHSMLLIPLLLITSLCPCGSQIHSDSSTLSTLTLHTVILLREYMTDSWSTLKGIQSLRFFGESLAGKFVFIFQFSSQDIFIVVMRVLFMSLSSNFSKHHLHLLESRIVVTVLASSEDIDRFDDGNEISHLSNLFNDLRLLNTEFYLQPAPMENKTSLIEVTLRSLVLLNASTHVLHFHRENFFLHNPLPPYWSSLYSPSPITCYSLRLCSRLLLLDSNIILPLWLALARRHASQEAPKLSSTDDSTDQIEALDTLLIFDAAEAAGLGLEANDEELMNTNPDTSPVLYLDSSSEYDIKFSVDISLGECQMTVRGIGRWNEVLNTRVMDRVTGVPNACLLLSKNAEVRCDRRISCLKLGLIYNSTDILSRCLFCSFYRG